jgi:hypothetical protein
MPSLQGPEPFGFQVSTHHLPEPAASTASGEREQIPVPEGQPAWTAVYHWLILFPVLSLAHNQYQLDRASAFQEKAGVVVLMLPEGDNKVALPGRTADGAVNVPASLHGP